MFVKVKRGGNFYYVEISDPESEDFTPNGIILSIINKLNIDVEGKELQFKDRDGAEIYFDDLPRILSQYKTCSCFYLEFCLYGTPLSGSNLKKELQSYLKKGDYSAIFQEYCTKQTLSDISRRCMVRESINFLRQRSGNYPNREEKIALAEAIIHLFPAYKVENSDCGCIDLFFNPAANTGYIVAKLKNLNTKRRKLSAASGKADKGQPSDNDSEDENTSVSQEDLEFFQNCLVADQVVVKQKLQQTLKARIKYCTPEVNVLQAFTIIVFDSSLLRYGELKTKALLNIWCKYIRFINEVANEAAVQSLEGLSEWSNDVVRFLTVLKLLPSTAGGRETKRAKFLKSLESFINFEELHTPIENYKVGSQQPPIIAVGENKSSISQYFINLDGKCINLPLECNFIQATSPRLVEIHSKIQIKLKALGE